MPYVLIGLHAVSITYTGTVFLFRQTHRNNIGPVSTVQNLYFCHKLYQSSRFQWKYQSTQIQFFCFDKLIGIT